VLRICVAGSNGKYLGLHGKCLKIFCPILTKFGVTRRAFIKKKIRRVGAALTLTDGHDEANTRAFAST
jgi:hypothetical protein